MKTTTQNTNKKNTKSGLSNRPEQGSTQTQHKGNLPQIDYRERETNRRLPSSYIMVSLARWMPYQHKLARVVGGLITIKFEQAPIQRIRQELSEFGFCWSEKHNAWKHYGRIAKGGKTV